ncbi:MAG: hypothetical protein Q9219_001295 [cf. Caloplaca sp. 3 TL-2023]
MPLAIKDLALPTPLPSKTVVQTPHARFQRLIRDIQIELGPKNGIVSSNLLRLRLESLLESYRSEEAAWKDFALGDIRQSFTRNLVDKGNGNYNLLVVVWSPGRESVIHDHANSHCIMKILKGTLTETRYAWPNSTETAPMQATQRTNFTHDQVTYMADTLGLHKISNPDPNDFAVSLHRTSGSNIANHLLSSE